MVRSPKRKYDPDLEEVLEGIKFILKIVACFNNRDKFEKSEGNNPEELKASLDPDAQIVLSGILELRDKYLRPKGKKDLKEQYVEMALLAKKCEKILKEYVRAEVEDDEYYPHFFWGGDVRKIEWGVPPREEDRNSIEEDSIQESRIAYENISNKVLKHLFEDPNLRQIKRVTGVIGDIMKFAEFDYFSSPTLNVVEKGILFAVHYLSTDDASSNKVHIVTKPSSQYIRYAANIITLQIFEPDKDVIFRNEQKPSDSTVETARSSLSKLIETYDQGSYSQPMNKRILQEFIIKELLGLPDEDAQKVIEMIEDEQARVHSE